MNYKFLSSSIRQIMSKKRVALTAFIAVCDSARKKGMKISPSTPHSGVAFGYFIDSAAMRRMMMGRAISNRALSHTAINAVSATRLFNIA